jgi:hypothetical protein
LKRIRFGRSGFEEDPVEIARKKPPPFISTTPGSSQETHEDTWKGRKLAEEAQDEVDSE